MDSSGNDYDTLNGIITILEEIKEEGFHLGLFCFPATELRCDARMQDSLKMIAGMMTSNVFDHIILVITQVNKLKEDYGSQQKQRIKEQVPKILSDAGINLNWSTILVYDHQAPQGNLDELLKLLPKAEAFVPEICHDFVESYVPGSMAETSKRLAEKSDTMKLVLQMMHEMKESREQMARQQQELMTQMQTQQVNQAKAIQEMRQIHIQEREELRKQKEAEMAEFRRMSDERDKLNQRNIENMMKQMADQQSRADA